MIKKTMASYDVVTEITRIAGRGFLDLRSVQNVKHTCVAAKEIFADKTTDLKAVHEVLNSCPYELIDGYDWGYATRAFRERGDRPDAPAFDTDPETRQQWLEWRNNEAYENDQAFNRWLGKLFPLLPVIESLPFDTVKHKMTDIVLAIAVTEPSTFFVPDGHPYHVLGLPPDFHDEHAEDGDDDEPVYYHVDEDKVEKLTEFLERWQQKCAADHACARRFWAKLFFLLSEFYEDAYIVESSYRSVENEIDWFVFSPGFQSHVTGDMRDTEWYRDPHEPSCRRLEDFVPVMVRWLHRVNNFAFDMLCDTKAIFYALDDVWLFCPSNVRETPLNMHMNHLFVRSVAVDVLAREFEVDDGDMLYDTILKAIYRSDALPFFEQMFPDKQDRLVLCEHKTMDDNPDYKCVYEEDEDPDSMRSNQQLALRHFKPELLKHVTDTYSAAIAHDPRDIHKFV